MSTPSSSWVVGVVGVVCAVSIAACMSTEGLSGSSATADALTPPAAPPEVPGAGAGPAAGPVLAGAVLEGEGPIELETVVSARWAVPLAGLLDLDHPAARGASLRNEQTPIFLLVHVVRHPTRGMYVVDTGVTSAWSGGGDRGLDGVVVTKLLEGIVPVEPLSAIVARQGRPLAGVFFTHMHIDHVLGLPEVAAPVPLLAGPGERDIGLAERAVLGASFDRLLAGHDLRFLDFTKGRPLDQIPSALDVFGDGSFYALHVPGHTHGSVAYLARTTKGPVMLAGDCSHTIWGWEHSVPPGFLSSDGEENAKSLRSLKALVAAHPTIRVVVGHETDGVGTGVR